MISPLLAFVLPTALAAPPSVPPDLGRSVHIHLEREVDAPPQRAWDVLAEDFAGIGDWSDGLDSRELDRSEVPNPLSVDPDAPIAGRVVFQDGQPDQLQVLVDFDSEERTFTFQAANPPKVIAYAHNAHSLTDLGDGRTRISLDVELVPKGIAKLLKGKIRSKFGAYMEAYLDEAAQAIEADPVALGGAQ